MDLSTMAAKLEAGVYPDRFAFEDDFHLMINNAKLFNPPTTLAHGHAVALEEFFQKRESPHTLNIYTCTHEMTEFRMDEEHTSA